MPIPLQQPVDVYSIKYTNAELETNHGFSWGSMWWWTAATDRVTIMDILIIREKEKVKAGESTYMLEKVRQATTKQTI